MEIEVQEARFIGQKNQRKKKGIRLSPMYNAVGNWNW